MIQIWGWGDPEIGLTMESRTTIFGLCLQSAGMIGCVTPCVSCVTKLFRFYYGRMYVTSGDCFLTVFKNTVQRYKVCLLCCPKRPSLPPVSTTFSSSWAEILHPFSTDHHYPPPLCLLTATVLLPKDLTASGAWCERNHGDLSFCGRNTSFNIVFQGSSMLYVGCVRIRFL